MIRRDFIRATGMCFGGVATFGLPVLRFARVPGDRRLVFVLLRGGFDGLAAVAPTFDPAWRELRRELAGDPSELIELAGAGGFALAPGLAPLKAFWERDELVVLHAMAIPYRTRSHFDGQAILETGLDRPDGASDGWLNRLLGVMQGRRSGIAVAAGLPRSLSGPEPVTTWSPARLGVVDDAYLDRLELLYRHDPELHNRFEAALGQLEAVEGAAEADAGERMMRPGPDTEPGSPEPDPGRRGRRPGDPAALFRAAARLLRPEDAPNVAAMELSGWDTHANQGLGGGRLDRLFGRLAAGIEAFREEMGDRWPGTTVVVMTEFGRTARPNGTRGTDHGTGGAGFLIGPTVARSALVTDWPGLRERDLFEGRDLAPALDTRAALKAAIAGTFDLTPTQANRVFPGSDQVRGRWEIMG